MGLFDGKKGLILGVANKDSIAWAIAQVILAEGGTCGFTHLPDRPDDEKKKNRKRVEKCIDGHAGAKFLVPMNVQDDEDIRRVMATAKEELGTLDFVLHSIAFADREDLQRPTIETSREGFKMAMDISAYSLLAVAREAQEVLADGGSICAMTYFGGEKCVPGYNVMGVCKAALEAGRSIRSARPGTPWNPSERPQRWPAKNTCFFSCWCQRHAEVLHARCAVGAKHLAR